MARTRKSEPDIEALLAKTTLPPASEWRRAPFLRPKNDAFWAIVWNYVPICGDPKARYILFSDEPNTLETDMIDLSSLVRLRIERGDFPFFQVQYKINVQPPKGWGDWVTTVLEKKEYRKTLDKVGLLKAVRLSRDLSMNRPQSDLDFVVSLWSTTSHTFIFPFGEAGPTLLDTETLMGLFSRGEYQYNPNDISGGVKTMAEYVEKEFKAAGEFGSRYDSQGRPREAPKANKTMWGSRQPSSFATSLLLQ